MVCQKEWPYLFTFMYIGNKVLRFPEQPFRCTSNPVTLLGKPNTGYNSALLVCECKAHHFPQVLYIIASFHGGRSRYQKLPTQPSIIIIQHLNVHEEKCTINIASSMSTIHKSIQTSERVSIDTGTGVVSLGSSQAVVWMKVFHATFWFRFPTH